MLISFIPTGSTVASILSAVTLDLITEDTCAEVYGALLTDNMICAQEDGKDACQVSSRRYVFIRSMSTMPRPAASFVNSSIAIF